LSLAAEKSLRKRISDNKAIRATVMRLAWAGYGRKLPPDVRPNREYGPGRAPGRLRSHIHWVIHGTSQRLLRLVHRTWGSSNSYSCPVYGSRRRKESCPRRRPGGAAVRSNSRSRCRRHSGLRPRPGSLDGSGAGSSHTGHPLPSCDDSGTLLHVDVHPCSPGLFAAPEIRGRP
jgi:hypothetical protein